MANFLGRSTPQLGWLRAFKNEQNLETPQITSATWASIPAVDLAVNHATQVRLSNEDIWLVRSLENQQPIKTCKFPGEKTSQDHLITWLLTHTYFLGQAWLDILLFMFRFKKGLVWPFLP